MAQKYFKANLEKLESLRIARGWSREKLADKAIVSTRTLDSIMAGKQAVLSTFAKLAKALDTPVNTIIPDSGEPMSRGYRRWIVTITISAPFDEYDETKDLPDFLTKLLSKVGGSDLCDAEVFAGSTKICFYPTEAQHTKLIAAIEAKTLGDLHIVYIRIYSKAYRDQPLTITTIRFPEDELTPWPSRPESEREDRGDAKSG